MKNRIIQILSIVLGVYFAIMTIHSLQRCNKNSYPAEETVVVRIDTLVQIDTFTVVRIDTFWNTKTILLPSKPVAPPVRTFVLEDSTKVNQYIDSKQDSNITITYGLAVKGTLEDIDISYKLKKPLTIKEYITETVTEEKLITKEIEKLRYKNGFYLGGGVGYSIRDAAPALNVTASFVSKKNYSLMYNYDLLNAEHSIGFSKKLF